MISYLNPGDSLTAARWNDIFSASDALLTNALGGLSAVLVGVDKQLDRGFFFFDPQNPPTTLHPLAANFLPNYLANNPSNQRVIFWRQYSHTAITGVVSGLSQSSNSAKYQVVKLSLPTWTAWLAAVYPSGFGGAGTGFITQTISSVVYPTNNCLDVSLQVLKQSVSGTPYNATFSDATTAEHVQPFKAIDVFINSALTWDTTNWDKYSLVRVHNCARVAATATFGSASASITPGASKCFRKLASGWIVCGNYFHTMQSGDGRFIQTRDATGGAASIFSPGIVADVLSFVLTGGGGINPATGLPYIQSALSNFGRYYDPALFWDMSPVYNNAGYTPTTYEKTPPAGGYFPALANSALLGDLIIHRGKVLVANRAIPNTIHATMMQTVVMTIAVPAPTYNFTDGTNTVANVSNAAVYNVTTGQTIPMQSNPSDITTVNWQVNYTLMQIAIIPRGSTWNGSGWVPITPTPYAPFISQGDVLLITFDYIPPDDHATFDFTGFANLATQLSSVGVTTRALSQSISSYVSGATVNNLEIYTANNWHLIDLSCPLVTFLTGGTSPLPAQVMGVSQTSTPKSLFLPWLIFGCVNVVANPTSANFTFYNWKLNSGGSPVIGSAVTVTVANAGNTQTLKQNIFLPTDSALTAENWINTTASTGGIISAGSFALRSTPFGTVLTWDEIWPLDARFTTIWNYGGVGGFTAAIYTTRIQYEPNVGLHVLRCMFLNETRTYSSYGGSSVPWEHGIFPPRTGSSRFMFWNFARVDQSYADFRFYYHDPADSPWIPSVGGTHYSSQSLAVKSFYEVAPLGMDTILPVASFNKVGISRMGAWGATADIWSPFSNWLNKSGNITYPTDGAGATGTINCGSGWYGSNNGSVLTNATISNSIPNVLQCQAEHFNLLASLVNAEPPLKYIPGRLGGTTFKLTGSSVFVVNPGSGYAVGNTLTPWFNISGFNYPLCDLTVSSVNGTGGITGVTVTHDYSTPIDAYQTPVRPFTAATGGGVTGTGATFDFSVGDGSALSFIPVYAPVGVTMPTGLTATIWPRGTFYSWNGATSGGADPIATYLGALTSIQTALPDSFGTAQPLYAYDLHNDGTITSTRITGYGYGFTPAYAIQSGTYRWVKIDDARTLYANLSLPFFLDAQLIPKSFQLANVTGTLTPTVATTAQNNYFYCYDSNTGGFNPNVNGRNPYYAAPTAWSGPGDTSTKWSDNGQPLKHIVDVNNGGGFLGDLNQVAAGFIIDTGGNWVTSYASQNLCSASSPAAIAPLVSMNWTAGETHTAGANYSYVLNAYTAGSWTVSFNTFNWQSIENYTNTTATYVITYPAPGFIQPPPALAQMVQDLSGLVILREGQADLVVACLPQNVAYYDEAWLASNMNVFNLLGTSVVPIIVDNTLENDLADITYITGVGGAGKYENVITTGLLNARLVTVAVDSKINPNPTPPGGGI